MKTILPDNRQLTRKSSFVKPLLALASVLTLAIAPRVHAASQTWTNAPVDPDWTNTLNWISQVIPGAVNSTTTTDVVTFNTPIFNGIGGASNPITNDFQRGVRGFLFDTSCGAYVFGHNQADNYLEIGQTGNITMNGPVANSIQFLEGMRFRGPSSQNYVYAITNNATSPNGTLYISVLTNAANSTTRPLSLTLAGSNTGTNTFAHYDDAADAEGAMLLFKVGAGRWILSSTNDFPQKTSASQVATVQVLGGTLEVQDPGSIGGITQANTIVGGAGSTLQIDNVTLTNGLGTSATGVTLTNGGTVRMNGSGTLIGLGVGTAASTSVTIGTTRLSDVFTIGNGATKLTGGASDTVTHVNGVGTTVLGFSSSYIGKWSFDAGTTQLGDPAALGTAAAKIVNIAAGATLDVSPIFVLGNTTYELPTFAASGTGTGAGSTAATINAGAGGTNGIVDIAAAVPVALTYHPASFAGDTTHPALYISQGTLQLNGNAFTVNNASGTALGAGTYLLVQQASGNITANGGSVATVTGSGLVSGAVATIQTVNGSVNLVVTVYVSQNLVWQGGNPGTIWDVGTNQNWLDGSTLTVFNDSDHVTFNSVGTANSPVTLVGSLAPSSVTVDTSGGNYTFTGAGSIQGSTSLVKINSGTLSVQNVNGYTGGTIISNGVISLGATDALPDAGGGDVLIAGPGTLDLNAANEDINGLNGSGTVDDTGGGAPALTIGNNGDNGNFSGVIQNTGGTVSITKNGNGTQVISGANNSYSGGTTINAGTLQLGSSTALTTNASVTINAGNLDINGFDLVLTTLSGGSGNIYSSSGAGTNLLSVISGAANTFSGVIEDNTGTGGHIALFVSGGGNLRLNGVNIFSGGTVVDTNTTLSVGTVPQLGTAGILMKNNSTFSMPTATSATPSVSNNITTADNAVVLFTSGETANSLNSSFFGSALATNVFNGNISLGGTEDFSNFFGRVIITNFNGAGVRFFNNSGVIEGGDNTIFDFETGNIFARNPGAVISLGALTGNGSITSFSNPTANGIPAVLSIGAKGLSTSYEGTISGSNSLVKMGAGTLKLDGILVDGTYTDGVSVTNPLYDPASQITYLGNTTVSNGTLSLIVPNLLTNSPVITLAGSSAVLDASAMGYVSNLYDENNNLTNTTLITNGILEIVGTNALEGVGTVRGTLIADVGSILYPGNVNPANASVTLGNIVTNALTNATGTGLLTITGSASIFGSVTMLLNRTNSANCGSLAAASFNIDPGATLLITNIGPALQGGDVFHLFNHPVNFANVTLPTVSSSEVLSNKLAIDGSLVVIALINTNSTNVTVSYNQTTGVGSVSWPSDHTGWRLQTQTNAPGVGITTNWVTVAGSTNVDSVNFTNIAGNGSVFFRMVYP